MSRQILIKFNWVQCTIILFTLLPTFSAFTNSPPWTFRTIPQYQLPLHNTKDLRNKVVFQNRVEAISSRSKTTTTIPMVWWFGGTDSSVTDEDDSCELVAVRIERTSPNSRRIGGEITIEAPIEDVWAILTDYDNLSTHVPNLVESRRVRNSTRGKMMKSRFNEESTQGDGNYECRLFQRGAQKIIGFEFGASVTMDMKESFIQNSDPNISEERRINFKCVDSQFFSEFDGDWKATPDPLNPNITTVSYVVDVRPKGPVPVAPLEWRIREDVPTNLRAVKKAAIEEGLEGVMALRARNTGGAVNRALTKVKVDSIKERRRGVGATRVAFSDGNNRMKDLMKRLPKNGGNQLTPIPVPVSSAQWDENETMAAYL